MLGYPRKTWYIKIDARVRSENSREIASAPGKSEAPRSVLIKSSRPARNSNRPKNVKNQSKEKIILYIDKYNKIKLNKDTIKKLIILIYLINYEYFKICSPDTI